MVSDSIYSAQPPQAIHCNCNPYYFLRCYPITLIFPNSLSHIQSKTPYNPICMYSLSPSINIPPTPPFLSLIPKPRLHNPSLKRPPPNPSPSLPPGPVPRKGLSPTRRILQQPPLPPVGAVASLSSLPEPNYQHRSCKPGCVGGPSYRYWCNGRGSDPIAP
jgi:hypothetical protein